MNNCFNNYSDTEYFAENRLIFEEKPEGVPSADELEGGFGDLLDDLKGNIEAKKEQPVGKKPKKPRKPAYHTRRKDTRELTRPKPRYKESGEIAKKAIKYKDILSPKEVTNIQRTQEHLYTHYMNPAFMLHLKQIKPKIDVEKIYKQLDAAVKNPYILEYRDMGNKRMEIIKKLPHTPENKQVPNKLRIVIEGDEGKITEVAGVKIKVDVDNAGYNKDMNANRKRFVEQHALNEQYEHPYRHIPEESRDFYVLDHIDFPKRYIALVAARGLKFETEDPLFVRLKRREKIQSKTYRELTEKDDETWQYEVRAHPNMKGAYRITIEKDENNAWIDSGIIDIDAHGYRIIQKADGTWDRDPRYKEWIRREYYKNPKARASLSEKEKKELDDIGEEEKKREKEIEDDKKAKEKRDKVDEELKTADLETLRKVAVALDPDNADIINKQEDEDLLRTEIIRWMDEDDANVVTVATALGV